MANISQVKTDSNWGDAASTINSNFQNINTELEKTKSVTTVKLPWATSVTELKKMIPNPYYGQLGLVGSSLPASVYKWNGSSWADTGETGGNFEMSSDQYLTYEVTGTI